MAFWTGRTSGRTRTAPAKRRNGRAARGGLRGQMRVTQRGMALILVVTSIAILTTVAVDFQYNSSVDLQLAANARDELRAEYLARSSINMSRLLLRFQRQLDAMGGGLNIGGLLEQMGMTAGLPPEAAELTKSMGGGGGGLNIRLWEIVPIDCSVMGMLTAMSGGSSFSEAQRQTTAPEFGDGDIEGALEGGLPGAQRSFGDFEGCFTAEISDEEQKINLNRLNHTGPTGMAAMQHAMALFADRRFDFLYEQPDANDVKMSAHDMIIAFHDWIDDRDTQAQLNLQGAGVDPFPDGFGDENRNYTGYPNRYRAKNAPFDTLDELYQVDGVSDLWMAAFRDRVTVYPDKNKPVNINTNDPIQQYANIAIVAANPNDPKLQNPVVIETILKEIAWFKMVSFTGMTVPTFVNIVQRNGIALRPDSAQGGANGAARYLTDKSETFTIKATGNAGKVTKTITAVVRSDNALGKLLYYREE